MKSKLLYKKASINRDDIMKFISRAEQLKSDVAALKGSQSEEVEKALDDATSAIDVFVHHMLDIAED